MASLKQMPPLDDGFADIFFWFCPPPVARLARHAAKDKDMLEYFIKTMHTIIPQLLDWSMKAALRRPATRIHSRWLLHHAKADPKALDGPLNHEAIDPPIELPQAQFPHCK